MQGTEPVQSTAEWLRDAGAAAVIALMGYQLVMLLKKVPLLIPASHHNAVIGMKDEELAELKKRHEIEIAKLEKQRDIDINKLEKQRDEYKYMLFEIVPTLKGVLEDARQTKRS